MPLPRPGKLKSISPCIEHTPMQTGGFSDEQRIAIFTKGEKPEGIEMRTTTKEKWTKIHKWTMDAAEQKGLVTYPRSLEPKSRLQRRIHTTALNP